MVTNLYIKVVVMLAHRFGGDAVTPYRAWCAAVEWLTKQWLMAQCAVIMACNTSQALRFSYNAPFASQPQLFALPWCRGLSLRPLSYAYQPARLA